MNWTRLGAALAVGVVAVWAALFALLSLFRIVLCAETEMHRTLPSSSWSGPGCRERR
jgi:hypothetical protein